MKASFTTPRQAVCAMVAAGAVFTVRKRNDSLSPTFTYLVDDRGDLQECRRILTTVKAKPRQFTEAFTVEVQRHVERQRDERGAA